MDRSGHRRPAWLGGLDRRLASGFVGDRQRWADQLREVAEPEPWPELADAPALRAAGWTPLERFESTSPKPPHPGWLEGS